MVIMQNICLFGDSVSKGVVFDSIMNRYTFAKNNFATLVASLGLNVSNFSKFGCTVTAGQVIVAKHIEEVNHSDFTVLEFGGNDCDYDWAAVSARPDDEHYPKTPLSVFFDTYSTMIQKLLAKKVKIVIFNLPPLDEHRYFDWISRGLSKENILKWLGGSVEYIYRWHEMYNMQVCLLANYYKIPMIDIRSAFLEKRDYSKYLCVDGIHPNELGHKLISQTISDYLPVIEQAFA
jgi:acyl-CoA thioesterase I